MTVRIGINGFGRMGRLGVRAAWDWRLVAGPYGHLDLYEVPKKSHDAVQDRSAIGGTSRHSLPT